MRRVSGPASDGGRGQQPVPEQRGREARRRGSRRETRHRPAGRGAPRERAGRDSATRRGRPPRLRAREPLRPPPADEIAESGGDQPRQRQEHPRRGLYCVGTAATISHVLRRLAALLATLVAASAVVLAQGGSLQGRLAAAAGRSCRRENRASRSTATPATSHCLRPDAAVRRRERARHSPDLQARSARRAVPGGKRSSRGAE